jgi:hypothetical protein
MRHRARTQSATAATERTDILSCHSQCYIPDGKSWHYGEAHKICAPIRAMVMTAQGWLLMADTDEVY